MINKYGVHLRRYSSVLCCYGCIVTLTNVIFKVYIAVEHFAQQVCIFIVWCIVCKPSILLQLRSTAFYLSIYLSHYCTEYTICTI